jgi:hypothetical protein
MESHPRETHSGPRADAQSQSAIPRRCGEDTIPRHRFSPQGYAGTGLTRDGGLFRSRLDGFSPLRGTGQYLHAPKVSQKNTFFGACVFLILHIVLEKIHEREIETILIRAAGPQLQFNDKKKRITIEPGNIRDYEAGTLFYERQYQKGPKP